MEYTNFMPTFEEFVVENYFNELDEMKTSGILKRGIKTGTMERRRQAKQAWQNRQSMVRARKKEETSTGRKKSLLQHKIKSLKTLIKKKIDKGEKATPAFNYSNKGI